MRMKNLAAALLFSGTMVGAPQASAEESRLSVSVDAVMSEANNRSFGRPNIFYRFLGMDGYTFIEMYSDDKLYFGKTMLSKKMPKGFSVTSEYLMGNDTRNSIGLGVKYSPPMPKSAKFSVKVLPLWINKNGHDKNMLMAGYFGSTSLPAGLSFSSFGEFNLAAENGPRWGYGEAFLGRNIGKHTSVNGGVLLRDKSDKENRLVPGLEKAVRISYSF